ncbi:MAG: hypothetical protein NG712_05385 [Omnitrophica bacterium]|nr:hypothetical protein [Candidatus Omnitrophota bacterium]
MLKVKKVIVVLLAMGLWLYFCQGSFVRAEDFSDEGLQFSVDGGKIYFFQPQTGRIFIYQITTNRFSSLLTLKKLGQDLKQSRSLSILEQQEEKE